MTADKTEAVAPEILEVDGDEILTEFGRVMLEWGHYKTAKGLRYPTLDEARLAAAGRRELSGWTVSPIPDGCSLFQPR
jgi:hypothetical protein